MTENNYLTVPTTPPTLIPLGLSAEDFAMLEESIKLWKSRITPPLVECSDCEGNGTYCKNDDDGREVCLECPKCKGSGEIQSRQNSVIYKPSADMQTPDFPKA